MLTHAGQGESAHHGFIESPHHARDVLAVVVSCFPDCLQTPGNTPTYHDPCRVQDITLSGTKTYTDAGTYHEWMWSFVYFLSFEFQLFIRCDKETGEVAAFLNDTFSDPYWGGTDSIWANFKVITATCNTVTHNLEGTFDLDYLPLLGPCVGMTITVDLN